MSNKSFDLISDLNLTTADGFSWENKTTSVYCVIAGGISKDMAVLEAALAELSIHYHGVFFIDGALEHDDIIQYDSRIEQIDNICKKFTNVVYLHDNVVLIDGIAILACNGWYGNYTRSGGMLEDAHYEARRIEDVSYMIKTLDGLQYKLDIESVVCISASIPSAEFILGTKPSLPEPLGPGKCLMMDVDGKVKTWMFGTYSTEVDTRIGGTRYVNNVYSGQNPYWAKRIELN